MMSDDSETAEDAVKAEVTDDSCTLEYIEIVPLERPSYDYRSSSEFIHSNVPLPPEDLLQIKQEATDESDDGGPHYTVKEEPVDEYETEASSFSLQVSFFTHVFTLAELCFNNQKSDNSSMWVACWCSG